MGGFSFGEFMREGGWGMFPTLIFGLVALAAGVRFAIRPNARWLGFTAAMWLTELTAIVHAMTTNVAAVFFYLEDPARAPDAEFKRILVTGLKESTRPGALGGIFLTLVAICLAVGAFRSKVGED